ncbi:hypothetical protein E4U59_002129 [Claviceps monticola]|nr:hypothetical protein E4U59_002129 [Claviceps monticola]
MGKTWLALKSDQTEGREMVADMLAIMSTTMSTITSPITSPITDDRIHVDHVDHRRGLGYFNEMLPPVEEPLRLTKDVNASMKIMRPGGWGGMQDGPSDELR